MQEIKRLDELCSVLEKMTKSEISPPKLVLPLWIQRAEKYSRGAYLFTTLVFLVLVIWQYNATVGPGLNVLVVVCGLLEFFVFIHVMTSLVMTWHIRKQHSSAMLTLLKNDLHHDAKFIPELWTFEKATLAYGLLQYRHRWSSFEGHIAGLAGDLRKLGLFPTLVAVILPAAALLKEDSNLFLWIPVLFAASIYLAAFDSLTSLKRPQQVIQLLEYAIQHADKLSHP